VVLDHYLKCSATNPAPCPGRPHWPKLAPPEPSPPPMRRSGPPLARSNGDADGTRELVDVLLLHRTMTAQQITAGITAALSVGAVTADVVAIESRRATKPAGSNRDRHRGAHRHVREQRVVSLTQRRLTDPAAVIAGLPPDTRPLPSVAAYDELPPRQRDPADPAGSDAKVGKS
jgi:hypothetical protein